jgi:2-polyprenyl-3-methyl-5-hydroxy-6-metoxy-1,4-benzoquinol methylase
MALSEVYSEQAYTSGYPEGIERHFWHRARNDLIYRWLAPLLSEGDLVMDVGCGTGLVVAELRQRGINACGVELGSAPVLPSVSQHVETSCDLFDLPDQRKREIKAVLLLDVIEHIAERDDFLARIRRECPNCGIVLVTVPARGELWSEFDEHWGHHLRYNRAQLRREVEAAGFQPQRLSYFFHWLYLASLSVKLLRLPRSTGFKPILPGTAGALLHRLLGAITRLENRIVPGALPGSSIACIARRTGP